MDRRQRVKRPQNAYILFSNERRRQVAAQNPNQSNHYISRLLGTMWNGLGEFEKNHYFLRAFRIREQHKRDNPGWSYDPVKARKRKFDIKENKKLQELKALYDERNQCGTLVWKATDNPPNPVFRSAFVVSEKEQSLPEPDQSTPPLGQFLDQFVRLSRDPRFRVLLEVFDDQSKNNSENNQDFQDFIRDEMRYYFQNNSPEKMTESNSK